MRTIYTLKEFRESVLDIANAVQEKYTSLQIDVEHNGEVKFKCYINGHGWHEGKTMEESLQSLKDSVNGKVIKDIDIELT